MTTLLRGLLLFSFQTRISISTFLQVDELRPQSPSRSFLRFPLLPICYYLKFFGRSFRGHLLFGVLYGSGWKGMLKILKRKQSVCAGVWARVGDGQKQIVKDEEDHRIDIIPFHIHMKMVLPHIHIIHIWLLKCIQERPHLSARTKEEILFLITIVVGILKDNCNECQCHRLSAIWTMFTKNVQKIRCK